MQWLVRDGNWPLAALFTAPFLLALVPLWADKFGIALTLVYVQLPLYLLHQWEEHADDRFRQYLNRVAAGGREALTPTMTFWINSLGVWGIDLAALYLAWAVRPALGLAAGYLSIVNAVAHLAAALRRREYNPGLWTAIGLFLPFGGWCIYAVARAAQAGWGDHLIGIGIAMAIHVAIIIHVIRRVRSLATANRSQLVIVRQFAP